MYFSKSEAKWNITNYRTKSIPSFHSGVFLLGKKWAVATVCHSMSEASFVSGLIANKLFAMCRSAEYTIPGFPDFQAAIKDLKKSTSQAPAPNYSVTIALGDGTLVIQEALQEFWTKKHPSFCDQMTSLVDDHNKEFNPKNLKRGAQSEKSGGGSSEGVEPSAKRLCLTTTMPTSDLESTFPERPDLYNERGKK